MSHEVLPKNQVKTEKMPNYNPEKIEEGVTRVQSPDMSNEQIVQNGIKRFNRIIRLMDEAPTLYESYKRAIDTYNRLTLIIADSNQSQERVEQLRSQFDQQLLSYNNNLTVLYEQGDLNEEQYKDRLLVVELEESESTDQSD